MNDANFNFKRNLLYGVISGVGRGAMDSRNFEWPAKLFFIGRKNSKMYSEILQ